MAQRVYSLSVWTPRAAGRPFVFSTPEMLAFARLRPPLRELPWRASCASSGMGAAFPLLVRPGGPPLFLTNHHVVDPWAAFSEGRHPS